MPDLQAHVRFKGIEDPNVLSYLFGPAREQYQTEQHSFKIDREKKVEQIYAKLIKTLPAPGDTFKKCYHCSEQVRVTHPSMLQRGMHITMPGKKLMWLIDLIKKEIPDFPFIYKHHAIITEVGEVNGQTVKLTLIHANNEEPHVSKRTETIDLKKEYLWIVKYKRKTLDNEAIAKAAEKQFEKKAPGKYHVLKRNCEHFATSCTLGEDQSVQVENLLSAVGRPLPGLIPGCQGLFRIITTVLDEIATGLFGSVAFAGIVLSVAGLANVLYTILMTVGYRKMEKENKLCPCCFKRKILELWMNLAVFIPTSALTFVLCNVAVPLATLPGIGISIVVILLTLLTQWGMSRIIRAICSPFDIEGSPVQSISEINYGDVVSCKYWGFNHYRIVTEKAKSSLKCVYYATSHPFATREVVEEQVEFSKGSFSRYDCSHLDTYSPKDTVERARMRISKKKWGPWENRSDHMCFWAKVRDFRPSGAKEHGLLEAVMMLGTTPIHLAHEIELGDHVYLHNTNGIVIEKEDIRKRRKFCLRLVCFVNTSCKERTFDVNLDNDWVKVQHYHPSNSRPKSERAKMAMQMLRQTMKQEKQFLETVVKQNV